ncbi:uncharacterized protein BP5553_01008 [Venustampulla echinocandica]|uniref:Cytochrome P450 n=1 Tax=Venustampulla echinocandica TaxID=2656787 RepID=A0A370TZS0_9HELO|nr:uncharacterized protein BP5553_01008 [Venustampulla echinocandica]RDL41029.1 hypothetical protein BP5553_01008 [Venustampulla echinocandica]
MLAILIGVVAIVVLTLGVQERKRYRVLQDFAKQHGCKPAPSENPYDLFGINKIISSTWHLLNKSTLQNTIDAFEKYGETYASRIAAQRVFFTCSPRNIKHILVQRFVDYDSSEVRAHLFRPITERGIFAVDGQQWRIARNLYRGQFSNTRSIVDLKMEEKHVKLILSCIPVGQSFDLQTLFLNLILDITTEFAIWDSVDSQSPTQTEEKNHFVSSLLTVKRVMARDGFLGPAAACHRFAEKRIATAIELRKLQQPPEKDGEERKPQGYSLLEGLTENSTNVIDLRDGATTILVAGIDSVASLLSTAFFLLGRNDKVFQKLRQSVLDAVGTEPPAFEQLKTLRVYPPVPFNARTANKDTWLPTGGGPDGNSAVLVKKGQRVIFSSWAIHRSFQTFGDDAHDFRPDRWEHLTAESLLGYLPFNIGPRACPGQQYALMEASYVAVRILQTFSAIKNCDPRPWTEHFGLNLSNENGVQLELVRDEKT